MAEAKVKEALAAWEKAEEALWSARKSWESQVLDHYGLWMDGSILRCRGAIYRLSGIAEQPSQAVPGRKPWLYGKKAKVGGGFQDRGVNLFNDWEKVE